MALLNKVQFLLRRRVPSLKGEKVCAKGKEVHAISVAEEPALRCARDALLIQNWPPFMQGDVISRCYWPRLDRDFGQFQFVLIDGNAVVGAASSIPFNWSLQNHDLPAAGYDAVLEKGMADLDAGLVPNAICALGITLRSDRRGQGLASLLINTIKIVARSRGIGSLVVPVRPTLKSLYPLMPFERYVDWTLNGEAFDPWIRTHQRQGAAIVKLAPRSMTVAGSLLDWEGWTGMKFPHSGLYIVNSALSPIEIDYTNDKGYYVEPNVWMRHSV